MADNVIDRMLQINTQLEELTSGSKQPSQRKPVNQNDLNRIVENYNQQAYGQPQYVQEPQERYDPNKEMERLKQINEAGGRAAVNLEGRNIPKSIVESILNNPLDLNPITSDSKMDALEEKLVKSGVAKGKGINASLSLMKDMDKFETEKRAKINEQILPKTNTSSIVDYELIKTIVESVVDKKLSQLTEVLNESASRQTQQYIPTMKFMNFKDAFHFVDSEDNVFVCEMKYKGKRTKKNK